VLDEARDEVRLVDGDLHLDRVGRPLPHVVVEPPGLGHAPAVLHGGGEDLLLTDRHPLVAEVERRADVPGAEARDVVLQEVPRHRLDLR